MKTSELKFSIHLDSENIPEAITWEASDASEGQQACKALIVSIWDADAKNALRIDLWTKDMPVGEMNEFFFQTLMTMADTYKTATGNEGVAEAMIEFSQEFIDRAQKAR